MPTFKKAILELCGYCGSAGTLWVFYLAITAKGPISVSTIRYISILMIICIIAQITKHIEVKWRHNTNDD